MTRLFTNSFVPRFGGFRGRDADLAVDFSMGLVPLKPALAFESEKPVVALATHVHADHIGAFHEFTDRLGHVNEAEAFAGVQDEATLADLFRKPPDPVDEMPHVHWRAEDYEIPQANLTRVLKEGGRIELGDFSFEILHLPGHSPGSLGLFDAARKTLFSGDAIYQGQLDDNIPDYLQTMRRLSEFDVETVFAGHSQPIAGYGMRAIAKAYLAEKDIKS